MLPILTNRQKLDNIKILVVKSLPTANLKIVTKPLTSLEAQNLYQAKTLGRIHIELYKIKINHHGKIPNECKPIVACCYKNLTKVLIKKQKQF